MYKISLLTGKMLTSEHLAWRIQLFRYNFNFYFLVRRAVFIQSAPGVFRRIWKIEPIRKKTVTAQPQSRGSRVNHHEDDEEDDGMGREKDEKVAGREQAGEAGNVHPTDAPLSTVTCCCPFGVHLCDWTCIRVSPVPSPPRTGAPYSNVIPLSTYEDSDATSRVMSAARRDAPARSTHHADDVYFHRK